ncbi:hypothetical protein Trydic_g1217 [Trypoxylus dichotomus]
MRQRVLLGLPTKSRDGREFLACKLAKIRNGEAEAEIYQMKRSSIRRLATKGRGFHCAKSLPYPGIPQLSLRLSKSGL